jgi:hypothetical protein
MYRPGYVVSSGIVVQGKLKPVAGRKEGIREIEAIKGIAQKYSTTTQIPYSISKEVLL